eukprot:IDg10231t1
MMLCSRIPRLTLTPRCAFEPARLCSFYRNTPFVFPYLPLHPHWTSILDVDFCIGVLELMAAHRSYTAKAAAVKRLVTTPLDGIAAGAITLIPSS